MKAQLLLLWAMLLSCGVGLSAVDLDDLFDDDDEATEEVVAKDDDADAEADEDDDAVEVEVVKPTPQPSPEPKVAAPKTPTAPAPAAQERESRSIGYRLLMWLPNRLVDLDDCVSLELGIGSKVSTEVRATRYLQFLGAYGDQYFIAKGYNRQYGGGYESGWNLQAFCWVNEKRYVEDVYGTCQSYLHRQEGFAIPTYSMDVYKEDQRDLWAIGAATGWLVNVGVHFHPVEFADFLTGIFLYDLRDDDF